MRLACNYIFSFDFSCEAFGVLNFGLKLFRGSGNKCGYLYLFGIEDRKTFSTAYQNDAKNGRCSGMP